MHPYVENHNFDGWRSEDTAGGIRISYTTFQQNWKTIILEDVAGYVGPRTKPRVTHPQSFTKRYITFPRGYSRNQPYESANVVQYYGSVGALVTAEIDTERDDLVFNKCYPKLLSQIRNSDLSLAVDAAEWRQSRDMVRNSVIATKNWKREATSALASLAKPLRNGSKSAANKWLEYVYGWRPLMQTVWGSYNFHRTALSEFDVKARASITIPYREYNVESFYDTSVTGSQTSRLEMSRLLRVTNPLAFDLTRLTTVNPLAIAWELVPYSFVVDWFFDVGTYLQDMETACQIGYEVVEGWDTRSYRLSRLSNSNLNASGRAAGYTSYSGVSAIRINRKVRVLASALPLPRPPSFRVNLGAVRILNAAALVRQLL